MSPRGFYTRESIHPHFTTQAYRESEAGKHEAAMELAVYGWFKGLISLPRKIAMKVWWFVTNFYIGQSRNQK